MDPVLLAATLDPAGIQTWAVKTIVPIIALVIGIGIMMSAKKGRFSESMSTVVIFLAGLVVVASGALIYGFAEEISGVVFS